MPPDSTAPPLPLAAPLADGESLAGWLERLARRHAVSRNELLSALGIAAPTRPQSLLVGLADTVLAELARRTRTPHELLASATLDPWADAGLVRPHSAETTPTTATAGRRTRTGLHTWQRWGLWSRAAGSRYCPACLRDGGPWHLRWHLTWSFACRRHQILLAHRCPSCRQTPYAGEPRGTVIPASPWTCHHRVDNTARPGRTCRCGHDLRTAECPALGAGHPVLAAQQMIDELLDRLRGPAPVAPVQMCGLQVPADHAIEAISTVITRAAAAKADLSIAVSHTLRPGRRISANIAYRSDPAATPIARMAEFDIDPAAFGIAATAAVDALSEPTLARAGTALERLDDLARPHIVDDASPASVMDSGGSLRSLRTPSTVVNAIELVRRSPDMSAAQQLAFRTANPVPRYPHTAARRGTGRDAAPHARTPWPHASSWTHLPARYIPQSLWPAVLDALPAHGRDTGAFARTIAMMLAHTGVFISWETIALQLELPESAARSVARVLRDLQARDELDETLVVLDRLAAALHRRPPPIDYARRRWIFRDLDSTGRGFRRACHDHDLIATGRRRRYSGLYLWELLTGGDIRQRPAHLSTHDPADRSAFAAFKLYEVPLLHGFFLEEAERLLLRHRIDEPITWQPVHDPDDGGWHSPPPDLQRRLSGWTSPSRTGTLRAGARDHTRRTRNALLDHPEIPVGRLCAALQPFTPGVSGPHERLAQLTDSLLGAPPPTLQTPLRSAPDHDRATAWCAPHQLTALDALAAALDCPPLAAATAPGHAALTDAGRLLRDRLAWTCPTWLNNPKSASPWQRLDATDAPAPHLDTTAATKIADPQDGQTGNAS